MAVELTVPSVGESINEVQIGDWLVPEGKSAEKEEAVVVIETDKVTVELPAPVAGIVTRVLKKKGDKATVGEVIGYMDGGGEEAKPKGRGEPERAPAPAKAAAAKEAEAKKPAPVATAATAAAPAPEKRSEARVMPSARRALHEKGLAPDEVVPSGPGGRLLKEDVLRADTARAKSGAPATEPSAEPATRKTAPASAAKEPPAVAPARAPSGEREEELVPMTPMRKRIAERLVQAKQTAALLTTFNEIDMSAVHALRKDHQESFLQRYGIKLGFMSFFVKASIDALKLVPQVNAEIRGDQIAYRNYYDIGVAVGGGKGLVVPVLRDAERLSFAEVEQSIAELAKRAQENKLSIEELTGGTFTISNGGIYGSLLSTPIVNPPQSGILGLHAIQDRPVAREGQVVIRPMMYVALTYDHRLVDGREAVTFLKRVKECVESPARMLLET